MTPTRPPFVLVGLVVCGPLLAISACPSEGDPLCSTLRPEAAGTYLCAVPGFEGRPFNLVLPSAPDPDAPFPVVLVLHGGGSNKEGAEAMTCPEGDVTSPTCFTAKALERGYAVVYPSGTGASLAPDLRTWNAGGGVGPWQCVSGYACEQGVDDVGYFRSLLAELDGAVPVDPRRVFSTGLSNGGAMSYRLACELSGVIAAVAPVGAGNQQVTSGGCAPGRPVPVLHIHGTADPCWAFDGGPAACAQEDGLDKISVPTSVSGDAAFAGWVQYDGCSAESARVDYPDVAADGTVAHEDRWLGCAGGSEVILLTIEGGGHTWPQGWQYNTVEEIGVVCQDVDASSRMLDFFDLHPL